jgi:hypothetical protein
MITILTDSPSPRLNYVADTLFKKWLELDYTIVSSSDGVDPQTCCIVYGNHSKSGDIRIFEEGLLFEANLRSALPKVSAHQDFPIIFESETPHNFDLPFDVFSAVLFCLSRYEEYVTLKRDENGRFKAEDSIFYGYHRIPYLDRWVLALESLIQTKLPDLKRKRYTKWLSTMDMDVAFAYKGRSFTRRVGATGKDLLNLRFDRLKERFSVLSGRVVDPFDTYDLFLANDGADSKRLFIPVGDRSPYDNNLSTESESMRQHISALQKRVSIGLHPSYQSLGNEELVRREKAKLERKLGGKITESRQHFLRFSLPETYRILQSIGVAKDYSMGFHDEVGFRAGTAYPYFFYDLSGDEELALEIIPLTAMDSAMKNYLFLSPEKGIEVIHQLLIEMKTTGGVFTTVWHNHSLSESDDWKGWRVVFQSTPDMVRSLR